MADRNLRTTIWVIVIIFLIISVGALVFIVVWIPPREGGTGVKVAILDSGINMDARIASYKVSRELKDNVILQKSFVTTEYGYESNSTWVDDTEYNHGTLVALQIASRSFGIAPDAELIIAKCADADGIATYPALLAAFNWAVEEAKADIVNISIGGPIIVNNTIVEAINKAALEEGVLTVISSGNSGDDTGYSLSSIEGPADALQAITVGASTSDGVAEYSSVGPMKDHSIKPDLVESGFTLIAVGTSFSAPKVVAKAAVLQSWCESQGYKTSPGLLKAALMKSASYDPGYPAYYPGAGTADIEIAKTLIDQAPKDNGWPLVSYIHPNSLPFTLQDDFVAFQGDIWNFPLTIITPLEQEFDFTSDLPIADSIIEMPSSIIINQSGLVDCKFVIPDVFPVGNHLETIIIESDLGETLAVTIDVDIEAPKTRIGFDVYHSLWEIDHLFGQFNELRLKLSNEDIALIELTHQENFSQLADFDAVIMADPNSLTLAFDAELDTIATHRNFTTETLDYLADYVETGHGLFIMSTDNDSACLTETNRLTNLFNISIEEDTIPETIVYNEITGSYNVLKITDLDPTHNVTSSLTDFDYLGAKLSILGDNAKTIAWFGVMSNAVLAAYESENNSLGRVVITGSNFMVDNMGINGEYNSTNNLEFIISVIEWLTNTTITPATTPKPTNSIANGFPTNQLSLNEYVSISSDNIYQQNLYSIHEPAIPDIYTIKRKKQKMNCVVKR
ncbi:MAG: S8 family serine peptidase [Asgard group archaeon]|nr:S8 family serine peptidase [Asgard group archaeon]